MTEILVCFIFSEDVGNDDGDEGGENGADENDADDEDVDDDDNENETGADENDADDEDVDDDDNENETGADTCRATMRKSLTGLKFDGYASDNSSCHSTQKNIDDMNE